MRLDGHQSSGPTQRQEKTDSQELCSTLHMYATTCTSLYLEVCTHAQIQIVKDFSSPLPGGLESFCPPLWTCCCLYGDIYVLCWTQLSHQLAPTSYWHHHKPSQQLLPDRYSVHCKKNKIQMRYLKYERNATKSWAMISQLGSQLWTVDLTPWVKSNGKDKKKEYSKGGVWDP